MTKLETTIRQVSDLRDFYLKIKKVKSKNQKTGASPTDTAHGIAGSPLSTVSRQGG